jgi:hypothetical protein
MEELGQFTRLLWLLTVIAQTGILALLLWHGAARRFPALFVYIGMTVAQTVVLFVTYAHWGLLSQAAWRMGWGTQAFVLVARAALIFDVCRRVLGPFRGIWALARWMLLSSGVLVMCSGVTLGKDGWKLGLTTAEMGLELAMAAVIVLLLLCARYYGIEIVYAVRWLAAGLCLYSCASVLNDAVLERYLNAYASLWNGFGMLSFVACLSMWIWAFRKRQPADVDAVDATDVALYGTLMPRVNWRLRVLNEELIRLWRPEAPGA